jgi:uncharacterized membrane protein
MENRVIIATFDDQNAAFEAAQDVQDLERSGAIKVKRGAIATKDANGNLTIPDVKYVGTSWGLLGGGAIGALLGLLLGPAGAAGALGGAAAGLMVGAAGDALSDGFRDDREDELLHNAISGIEPGQTVLLAELDEESTEPVDTALTRRGGRVFRTNREAAGKVEQVRQKIQRDLAARRAKTEQDIEKDEAQRAWENDTLRQHDMEMVHIMTTNQQSEYDVYAESRGPASTRPIDDRLP